MPRIMLLKGLPASGKSTWAKDYVLKNKDWKRINKDDIREMLQSGLGGGKQEKYVLQVRDALIRECLSLGLNVIVDDTNLNPIHEARMHEIAKEFPGTIVDVRFFGVSLEDAIQRDLRRQKSVGEAVIKRMYYDYLHKETTALVQDPSLPKAVIVDIDGTIAHMKDHRGPFDWHLVDRDEPNHPVVNLVNILKNHYTIIYLSGRDSVCRDRTEDWIDRYIGVNTQHPLYMRPMDDMRKDSVVKKELFDAYVRDKYFVEFVLDDRNQVVDLWRKEIGLPCFQVAEGNF